MIDKFKNSKKVNGKIIAIIILLIVIAAFIMLYDLSSKSIIITKNENSVEAISLSAIVNQDDYVLQRINEKFRSSNIEVYYPVTKYDVLNKEVKNILDDRILKFKESIKDDVEYSMFINFDIYKYDNYIGYVFRVIEDYAGTHPNSYIFTVNYNVKNNSIINIDTLISKNNSILNLMSNYSYTNLSCNDKFKEINMPYMLTNGTKPIKSNFKSFVFTKDGIIVFFEKYQVAPYVFGEFWITIPYLELNLNINE